MENFVNEMQELSIDTTIAINGGAMSKQSLEIGLGLWVLCPILGAGYFVGYYMNS